MALHTINLSTWDERTDTSVADEAVQALESGSVLLFPQLSFELLPSEQKFLSEAYSNNKAKNISYDINTHRMKGVSCGPEEEAALKAMLGRFAKQTKSLVEHLFPNYVGHIIQAKTSFRPVEIQGRIPKSYKKDDTRLHVDAFPSNPNQGKRILRIFSNINNQGKCRFWHTGEAFEEVANRFASSIRKQAPLSARMLKLLGITKSYRTPYDHLMLNMHDTMKADLEYQQSVKKLDVAFPPNTSWAVFTDQVSHAVISGQHALEQTFYLPVEGMQNERKSPLRILETMTQRQLVPANVYE